MTGLRFDTLYLGADAIDADFGLSTFNEDEARQSAAMVRLAARVVVLADSSKFGKTSFVRFGTISQLSTVISDKQMPPAERKAFLRAGVETLLV